MSGSSRSSTDRVAALRPLVERTRPVAPAGRRLLPVLPVLEPLLSPGGGEAGLRRGSVVGVSGGAGATALALALVAGPTRAGSWAAFVGTTGTGWAAAGEIGVDLQRVVVVHPPGSTGVPVIAALVDAFDVVVCGFGSAVSTTEARRLAARARERGAVLVIVGGQAGGVGRPRRWWPEALDVRLAVVGSAWTGPDDGAGHLQERRLVVEVGGRRGLDRSRRAELVLPDRAGGVDVPGDAAASELTARVLSLRQAG